PISRGCTNVVFGISTGFTKCGFGVDFGAEELAAAGGGGGGGGGGGAAPCVMYARIGLSSASTLFVADAEMKRISPMSRPCAPMDATGAFQPPCDFDFF